ncbi:META domain-containing protein [Flavobacterium salilacus subsp. salilacus]|uniref:META domain-containing protein n=1 Tax=Flavobacterium TaxID=237 RepID=UPI00107521D8|nr:MULTISPECIES: META domain-containing protein [Flavobacterium]KAF2516252.1 META domain-containing protein [Flavobacterium salilacus subsp. salilacus]MBE1613780.1 META domain-containing protein [Flavobacterium sp. SaA2.13]
MKRARYFGLILVITLLAACGGAKSISKSALTETSWQLKSLNDDVMLSGFNREIPYINFTEDNRISGNTGCNNFSGAYSNLTDEGTISFSKMVATKMYCDGVPESEFLNALNQVNGIKKNKEQLIFLDNDKPVMVFVAKK